MGPIIIFQLVLSSIHEWVSMIHLRFFSIQVFNTTSECYLPWAFSWHVHYYFRSNIFFIVYIINVVLTRELFRHHVPICFVT